MALEISVKQPNPTAGGYKSVNVYFNMNTGGIYFNGNVELPGKFATANDAEILEEIRKQIAVQMYTGEATPALVAEYANLNKQIGILAGNKEDVTEREKALTKLFAKVNKGNDKVLMTLLLDVLDPKTITTNKDKIINAFDSYDSVGDKFKFNGKLYEVITEHTSVVEWVPSDEPTKYKEITFERTENKEQLEDDNNRYVTKLQLDQALTKVVQTIMEQLSQNDEGEEEHENNGESSNTISNSEGVN